MFPALEPSVSCVLSNLYQSCLVSSKAEETRGLFVIDYLFIPAYLGGLTYLGEECNNWSFSADVSPRIKIVTPLFLRFDH